MILIQVLLIIAILAVFVRFLASGNSVKTQAWKKILLIVFTMVSIACVLLPDILNNIANFLGVGRGADLLLYGLAVAFIFVQLNNYIKAKDEKKKLVALARKVAILETTVKSIKSNSQL